VLREQKSRFQAVNGEAFGFAFDLEDESFVGTLDDLVWAGVGRCQRWTKRVNAHKTMAAPFQLRMNKK
jgi:hypothetical protein